ncbi:RED-like N-terminal [Penicillium malachiteum]|uniref:RED-like N-terminal n=1 Tax=Penicillium malachiteum TaxID=1324776 RepID=UPI0025488B8F|nr:RED-like N-terminal [Penicillium malachiteum]KAJ5720611.1 RED-like N-terminal [Penicillium malachiteum]
MNNEQFRRLLADNSSSAKSNNKPSPSPRNASSGNATPASGLLGSRMRSSIPMTPRAVSGVDFARQLAEQRREGGDRPTKRFKSSAAPKGSKLPSGYQDRAHLRNETSEQDEDDLSKRIKALEDMVKLGQIDQATFENLRTELGVGGNTSSTHMIKGLDWELLRRARAGEDIEAQPEKPEPAPSDEPVTAEDAEAEFERLMEEKGTEEIQAAPKEQKEKKKGNMAPPPASKKTRDEILQELKAKRAAASAPAPPPESILGAKFKKLGDGRPEKKRFVETDKNGRRREVLLITDAEGNTKRKTRWLDKPGEYVKPVAAMPMPEKDAKPLGMEVPAEIAAKIAASAAKEEEEDDDIFAGVGADYDPLAGIEDEEDSSSDEEGEAADSAKTIRKEADAPAQEKDQGLPGATAPASKPRNYFATSSSAATAEPEPEDRSNPLTKDPTILAALKRAAALRQASPSAENEAESTESSLRQKRFLEEARRRDAMDDADMDFGFGGSRNEDGDEEDDTVLLDFEDHGGKKRKRGPKKRKGDKDSAEDVMRVLEGRQKDSA